MEQAVFFADRSENPLSFDVTSSVEGDISAAAEAVSAEILSCSELLFLIHKISRSKTD